MQNRVESDVGIPFSKSIYPSQLNTSKLQIGKGERGSDMVGTSPPLRTAEGMVIVSKVVLAPPEHPPRRQMQVGEAAGVWE